jgi:phosphoserine phosphatase RsbU/P
VKILLAEDEPVSRHLLETILRKNGYRELIVTSDGNQAWEEIQQMAVPMIAILDLMMPGMDGIEVCRNVRQLNNSSLIYVILLTALNAKENVIAGLGAGADDYITKPFDPGELCARVQIGWRFMELQKNLADRVKELEEALSRVKQLQGLLPICSYCKKVRDDDNYWQQVDSYIAKHSDAQVTHGICPDCFVKICEPELEKLRQRKDGH